MSLSFESPPEFSRLAIGVDLGGTKIAATLVDPTGLVLARARQETRPEEGVEPVIERICRAAQELVSRVSRDRILGVGVGAAAMTDSLRGVVIQASNLGWKDVPLRQLVQERLDLPTFVDKDTNVAALAEHRFGAGRGARQLFYVTIGTGIGGGMILDGRVYHGASQGAGDFGHITLVPEGPLCGCGNVGCLEALASGPAIARQAVEAIHQGRQSHIADLVQGKLETISAETVGAAAKESDPLALELFAKAGYYLGLGLAIYINLNNPEVIIIGGGVAAVGELLLESVRATVQRYALPLSARMARIAPAMLGEDVGAIGAAALVFAQTTIAVE